MCPVCSPACCRGRCCCPASCVSSAGARCARARRRPAALGFFLLSSLLCLVFFSASGCKRPAYILPAMPPLALALGCYLNLLVPRPTEGRCRSAAIVAMAFAACSVRHAARSDVGHRPPCPGWIPAPAEARTRAADGDAGSRRPGVVRRPPRLLGCLRRRHLCRAGSRRLPFAARVQSPASRCAACCVHARSLPTRGVYRLCVIRSAGIPSVSTSLVPTCVSIHAHSVAKCWRTWEPGRARCCWSSPVRRSMTCCASCRIRSSSFRMADRASSPLAGSVRGSSRVHKRESRAKQFSSSILRLLERITPLQLDSHRRGSSFPILPILSSSLPETRGGFRSA